MNETTFNHITPDAIYLCRESLTAEDIFTAALMYICNDRDTRDADPPIVRLVDTGIGARIVDEPNCLVLGNISVGTRPKVHFSDMWLKYRDYLDADELFYEYFNESIGKPLADFAVGKGTMMDITGVFNTALTIKALIRSRQHDINDLLLLAQTALDNAISYWSFNRDDTSHITERFIRPKMAPYTLTFSSYVALTNEFFLRYINIGEETVLWGINDHFWCMGRVRKVNNLRAELIPLPDEIYKLCERDETTRRGCDGNLIVFDSARSVCSFVEKFKEGK